MKTRDLLELNGAHLMLVKHKGLNRTAAYRAHKNSAVLQSRTEEQRAAFMAVVEKEKAANGNGEMTNEEQSKLQNEIWKTVQEEETEVPALRKLPAAGLPWEELEPEVSAVLIKHDLVDGEVSEESA
jgi:hypothetical protein